MPIADRCPHYPKGVPPGHTCDAPVLLVGDRPDTTGEQLEGYVFAGWYGHLLKRLWADTGCDPAWFYCTYALATDGSPVLRASEKTNLNKWGGWVGTTRSVVVACGEDALRALTGRHMNITNWRGSWIDDYDLPILPVLPPSYLHRLPGAAAACLRDWTSLARRIKDGPVSAQGVSWEGGGRDSALTMDEFLSRAKADPDLPIAIDIETSDRITIFGVACSPFEGCSVEYAHAPGWVAKVCALPNPKIGQNFDYDRYWLAHYGHDLTNVLWDTGIMWSALDPAHCHGAKLKPFSLAYMATYHLGEKFYKTEDGKAFFRRKTVDELRTYNLHDCCVTWRLWETLKAKLEAAGRLGYYLDNHAVLFDPLFRIMRHGVRLDIAGVERSLGGRLDELTSLRRDILTATGGNPLWSVKTYKRKKNPDGTPFVVEGKSISNRILAHYLYKVLKLPRRTHHGKVTVDDVALKGLIRSAQNRLASTRTEPSSTSALTVLKAVQRFRAAEKTAVWTGASIPDADGRVRCQYKQTIVTGRLSSRANPRGTGTNLQNISKKLLKYFLPDEGRVFLMADLAQAEDVVVRALAGLPPNPPGVDAHAIYARRVYAIVEDGDPGPITKDDPRRQMGKRLRHATNYDLGPGRLIEILEKDAGILMPYAEAEVLLAAADQVQPEIRNVYHAAVRAKLLHDGKLTLSTGRCLDFSLPLRYARDAQRSHLFKSGYATIPQGEVGMLMNRAGILVADALIEHFLHPRANINMQIHDEIVMSVEPDITLIRVICTELSRALTAPFDVSIWPDKPRTVTIPVDFTLGRSLDKAARFEFNEDTPDAALLDWLRLSTSE